MSTQIFNPLKFPDGLAVRNEERPCPKLKFSKREARIALRKAKECGQLGNPNRREQHTYECPVCGWWHLTKNEQWNYQRAQPLREGPHGATERRGKKWIVN
jgi:hypothetical protein